MTDKAIAWADDAALNGGIGNVASDTAKRYWQKSDWVDKKSAELLIHPLYAQQAAQPDCRTCDYYVKFEGCTRNSKFGICTNGDKYVEAPKVVLWRTE